MNAIVVASTAAILAATATYAHGTRPSDPLQPAGTLTCTTRSTAGLVFGHTPVADCTFVSSRGGLKQSYVALFSPLRRPRDAAAAETVRWEVMTRDGFSRPGMVSGSFQALADQPEISQAAGASVRGVPVTLRLVGHSGQRIAHFALATPRIAFAAATEALVR
ncbi:Protein of unknown function [Methylobacterium sp. 174MFSha1.1]|uniref:DUF992 domain-containing protein n=1 Tax=Methylobacterium sp. 174MFSha1.1 TaxID=1502749 RepID=UPI0008F29871|nr:DUF992 domain-containing protein [Methylobacterium sp. 174MFSha1.1]SFU48697.1 Protein of unknown function [Methylobacterium sp. 174MFSha1.1]